MTYSGAPAAARPVSVRWLQLIAGIICMVMIANLQYGWTLFVAPMNKAHGWAVADIQIAFSIFVALETWLTPIQGWIADRLGPKFVVAAGGILVAAGWILNAYADALWILYLGAAITGTGAGAVYATCVGNSVKWFPDRRGLAVGLTAAGFGAGAALTVIPIRAVIAADGYAAAFFWFGLIQGVVVFLLAWLLRAPAPGETPATAPARVIQTTRSYTPQEILRSPVFWVLYVMFVLVSASGLMATAQIALIARDFGVANTVLLWGGTTLTIALLVDNICNGAARPLFGWISDHIGREYTMALAFGLGGISYWLLGSLGTAPWAFVLFAGLIFLTWGEIFSLFPSTCTDSFGPRYATANLSLLYTAKGVSAFLVPVANLIKSSTGSWHMVFVVTAAMNFLVVVLALFVLRPLRSRQLVAPVPEFAAVQRPT
ncbi:MAG: oxalate/formate MFS antiporter [Alphaproteobacteria bacterium]|nr:oxalate/formate MFS antiporter [Alphaproteobacteria bacterium]